MSRPHFTPGSRPLLFERLVTEPKPGNGEPASQDAASSRLLDQEALRASLGRELTDLFNTRVPTPIQALEGRTRSTIDYGIPDLSAFPIGEHDAMLRLAKHVRDAVLAYEPRLSDPEIEVKPRVGSANTIGILIRGGLKVGMMRVPVVFRLALGVEAANVDAD